MDQAIRNNLQNATQQARRLLEQEIAEQLEGTFDVMVNGTIADEPGKHLDAMQRLVRTKLVETIRHRAGGSMQTDKLGDAVFDYIREAAFTILNRYIALKMLEVRGLVQQCISKGDQSGGFKEFCLAAPGLAMLPDKGYRLYLECLFDELSIEVKILFDRHDHASLLWPRRQSFDALLAILNADDLAEIWKEDETIGWVYQYFNSKQDREEARYDKSGKPKAPQNSRELAVRNQFFTPRYVVEFLTDNTLGRIWYEMRQGETELVEKCRYLVRRPDEVFLENAQSDDAQAAAQWLRGHSETEPVIMALAHTVNGYRRAGAAGEVSNAWVNERLPKLRMQGSATEFKTQELLDLLFLFYRKEHFCEGTLASLQSEIDHVLVELRKRVEALKKEDATQEELLRQPVFIPFRAQKDPRDIKILDPACGSSHFLLYCFDLLLTIYEEAWHDEGSPSSEVSGNAIRKDYQTIDALRAAVPGLILRHNVHGIDIDPRCAQIGAFALWMRAQRAYNDFQIAKDARSPITKSNVVVAEPMPGEEDLFGEFLHSMKEDRLESLIRNALKVPANKQVRATKAMADSLCDLVRTIWNSMKLAGEAGSLLQVESDLRAAIERGREEWEEELPLFRVTEYGLDGAEKTSLVQHVPGEEADFWSKSESLVLHALRGFAGETAKTSASAFRRGLFEDDAARGFAFIDVCRKRFDVILMNPPFGKATKEGDRYIQRTYPTGKFDLASAFVDRAFSLSEREARNGQLTTRSPFYAAYHKHWRSDLLSEHYVTTMADLGVGVLDGAMVEVCATVISRGIGDGTYFAEAQSTLQARIVAQRSGQLLSQTYFQRNGFPSLVPEKQFNYWLSAQFFDSYQALPFLEQVVDGPNPGASTGPVERFVRFWMEVPAIGTADALEWAYLAKGGEYAFLLADIHLVIKWTGSGRELKAFHAQDRQARYGDGNWRARLNSYSHYFLPGVFYSRRSQLGFSMRALPAGCVFSEKAPTSNHGSDELLLALIALSTSSQFQSFVSSHSTFGSYEVGAIGRIPMPLLDAAQSSELAIRARRAYACLRLLASTDPRSLYFRAPWIGRVPSSLSAIVQAKVSAVSQAADACQSLVSRAGEMARLVYGPIQSTEGGENGVPRGERFHPLLSLSPCGTRSKPDEAESLIDCIIGAAFGRFDMSRWTTECATGGDPFEHLPNLHRREVNDRMVDILVDDSGHDRDLLAQVSLQCKSVWTDQSDSVFLEALGVLQRDTRPGGQVREYLRKSLFDSHIARYSKSGRRAPVYWQLSTASASYSVWLYYHGLTLDTFFKVLNEYVKPKVTV